MTIEFVPYAEALARRDAGTDEGLWTVFGSVVSDPNGPVRWRGVFETFAGELGAREVEGMAVDFVYGQITEGRRGVLIVAAVCPGVVENIDTYAVYGDDPERPDGFRDSVRPWVPPQGFEGLDERRIYPVLPGTN